MKKTILFTLMVMISMSMSAQRVIPITFKLTEFNLDTMRATYQGSAYLLELQRLDKLMKDDSKMLSDLQKQLKAEKDYYKQMSSYADKAEGSFKSLQSLSEKELSELNKLKEMIDKQHRYLNSAIDIDTDTRAKSIQSLQAQRQGLDEAINGTTARQTEVSNHLVQVQQIRTSLIGYNNELTNKETDLKQLESTLKANRDIIKSETKNVKSQK